jgi:hypothetical protein
MSSDISNAVINWSREKIWFIANVF